MDSLERQFLRAELGARAVDKFVPDALAVLLDDAPERGLLSGVSPIARRSIDKVSYLPLRSSVTLSESTAKSFASVLSMTSPIPLQKYCLIS